MSVRCLGLRDLQPSAQTALTEIRISDLGTSNKNEKTDIDSDQGLMFQNDVA